MPNHWHMVLWPEGDHDLTKFLGWMSETHACRWHLAHGTRGTGPVYQGRFKGIPVQTDDYLLTVNRYVERNAVRAGLATRAEDWPWCRASTIIGSDMPPLHPWPLPRPPNWSALLNDPEPENILKTLRECVSKSKPYGSDRWVDDVVERLGWTTGLRPVGRPKTGKSHPE